ncbi:MAG: MaoC family dehydratase, partial [Chloroflexi bacterium]|nr:MaoC family dehydratase [Chloroflexota bacterium]
MSEEPETLVTEEMIEAKGVWGDEDTSHPVTESDIRKWAIATYWPDKPPPLYWDDDYARGTKWGGIIAPRDFNPFAWPVDRPGRGGGGPAAPAGAAPRAAPPSTPRRP